MKFASVQYKPEGAPRYRTIYLKDPTRILFCDTEHITGSQVDKLAQPLNRVHIISSPLVKSITEVVISRHYGLVCSN